MEKYFQAIELASYISKKYEDRYKTNISGIKLQKSLYFLFAYWGGFVRKLKNNTGEGKIEENNQNLKEWLFDDKIQAWIYGPVIPSIYNKSKKFTAEIKDKINLYPEVHAFIDDLLEDIFSTSDFKLVDISHEDKCWQNNFNDADEKHDREIPKEEIITEYASK